MSLQYHGDTSPKELTPPLHSNLDLGDQSIKQNLNYVATDMYIETNIHTHTCTYIHTYTYVCNYIIQMNIQCNNAAICTVCTYIRVYVYI